MKTNTDYLIIGAGPAGLQLGYYLEKNKRDYLILEKANRPGALFAKMPRHRMLVSINKVHTGTDNPEANMRWDWNSLLCDNEMLQFKHYSQRYFPFADDLCRYLEDFARYYELNIQYSTKVINIQKEDDMFVVTDAQGKTVTGKRLIIATGVIKPNVPDIPGVELCETYNSHNIDPTLYTNKRVMVVGKGNSAFETADNLVESAAAIHIISPESVKFAWQTHYVGHLRAVNNNFLDTYQLKSQNTVIDADIEKIEKEGDKFQVHIAYSHAHGQKTVVEYDHVIFCTGFNFDPGFFGDGLQPELTLGGRMPAMTSEWEATNIPDMFYAGFLMHSCDFKKTMSGFIHGFRHNIETLSKLLEVKYHDVPWPRNSVPVSPQAVLNEIIQRVNNGPGIFLQPGFLCDVVIINEQEGTAEYFTDIRKDYVPDGPFSDNAHYYTISLEYGHFEGDPFNVERDPASDAAHDAAYLHPVIRRFSFNELVNQHHINDDLESHWYKDEYVMPALAYFEAQFTHEPTMAMD